MNDVQAIGRIAGPRVAARFAANIGRSIDEVVRTGTLTAVDRRMAQDRPYDVTTNGATVLVPGWAFASMREMYARNVYMWPEGFTIRKGDVAVDLGCNMGFFTLLAARLGARVVSVDAQASFAPVQREILSLNGCERNVEFELALVGGDSGMFSDEATLHGASHFAGEPKRMTMDELLAAHHVETIDFMKIDIEGSEYSLFASGTDWLDRVQRIAMEVHAGFGDPETLVRLFRARGLTTFRTDNDLRRIEGGARDVDGYIYASRSPQLAS